MCSKASLVHNQGSAAAATLGGPAINNQGVALSSCATAEGVTSSRAGGESRDLGAAAAHRGVMLCSGDSLVHIQDSAETAALGGPQVGLR